MHCLNRNISTTHNNATAINPKQSLNSRLCPWLFLTTCLVILSSPLTTQAKPYQSETPSSNNPNSQWAQVLATQNDNPIINIGTNKATDNANFDLSKPISFVASIKSKKAPKKVQIIVLDSNKNLIATTSTKNFIPHPNVKNNKNPIKPIKPKNWVVSPLTLKLSSPGQYKVKAIFTIANGETSISYYDFKVNQYNQEDKKSPNIISNEQIKETILWFCKIASNNDVISQPDKEAFYAFINSLDANPHSASIVLDTLNHWPIVEDTYPFAKLCQKVGELAQPADIEVLERTLHTEPLSEEGKLWGLCVLSSITSSENIEKLSEFLKNSQEWLKFEESMKTSPPRAAAEALAKIGTKQSLGQLIKLCDVPPSPSDYFPNSPKDGGELKNQAIQNALEFNIKEQNLPTLLSIVEDKNNLYTWQEKLVALQTIKIYWDKRSKSSPENEHED